nr:5-methyltetrahydropteroyltriglutamate--homocysteine S-methyltransferase [Cryptosporangium phraense]
MRSGVEPDEPATVGGVFRRWAAGYVRRHLRSRPGPGARSPVSVVVPLFNQGRYVRQAIESVRAQETAAEIVVVDDPGRAPDRTTGAGTPLDDRLRAECVGGAAAARSGVIGAEPRSTCSTRASVSSAMKGTEAMTARTRPPFRADHVGSLLRPPKLLAARADFAAGRIPSEELRAIEDDAIRTVVREQENTGLRTATDGEFRRTSWHMDFIYRLGGVHRADEQLTVKFRNAQGGLEFTSAALRVDGPITLPSPIFADDFLFLKDQVTTGTPKLTIPSPSMVHYRGGRAAIDPSVYPDLDQFWTDLSAAYAEQVRAIADLGCTYLQLDDTSLAYLNDPAQREMVAAQGGDPDHQHERYIAQINAALAGRPDGLSVTTHMCRGNFRSSWAAEGGYDFVAEALFTQLDVDGFFLEYDDERSGDFSPLRFVPPGKQVVLGLVTTKSGALESKDDLKRRIDEASKFVSLDQICLSPQCGFSSTVEGNALTAAEQWAKLRLIVEVAEEVWG